MASCNDIAERIRQLQADLDALDSTRQGLEAVAKLADGQPKLRPRILRSYTGDEIRIDPGKFAHQAEKDAMAMGSDVIQQMVEAGFNGKQLPNGRTGRMVNYAQLTPDDENIAALLELMGLRRTDTEKGVELMRPFTASVAVKALMNMAQTTGADPRMVAEALKNKTRGFNKIPATVVQVAKARWDAATQYADVLEELADAIEGGYLTDSMKHQAGNIGKWAYFFEQMDVQVRRSVGQGLRAMQFGQEYKFDLVTIGKDVQDLTFDQISGNTMLSDMMEQVDQRNAQKLRQIAAAKRSNQALGLNEPGFFRDLTHLNSLRRANLLSSFSTWAVRNPISGLAVQGVYAAEDVVGGTLRMMNKNGLKAGVVDGARASFYAAKAWTEAFSMSARNFTEALATGKTTVADGELKYVDSADELRNSKSIVNTAFTEAWSAFEAFGKMQGPPPSPVSLFNLINGGFWKVIGEGVEKATGTDAGYMATFRILNATDDFMQTQAFAWKSSHEAFLRAAEEGRTGRHDVAWVERRANELADGAMFKGTFTDDELAQYRKARNAEYGMPVGDEVSNDELRAQLFLQLNGVPNEANEIGRIALGRAKDSTFTGDATGLLAPVLNGVQQARQNPLVAWALPFWKVPMNGVGWILNRDLFYAVPRQVLMEGRQFLSDGKQFTPEQMADARARTVVAAAIAMATHVAWENGFFTDGGSFDLRQRDRERRNWKPYSFSAAGTVAAGVKLQANSIDLFDLMGLQADISRAFHDGVVTGGEAKNLMTNVLVAHANIIKNKAALKNITGIMNWLQDPQRYDFGRVLGDQLGGLMPISGFGGNISRGFANEEEMLAKRRYLSANEMAALKGDPNYGRFQAVTDALQVAADAFTRGNAGILGGFLPREKDWLGNSIERPLGLPLDQTIPFMPVIKPQDPLYQWLEKHGFADKPRPDGTWKMGETKLQMSNEEENFYRETMRTARGDTPPEALRSAGVSAGKEFPIWQYVQGQDLQGALRNLMRDPRYNALLNDPAGGLSPSLSVQKGKSLAKRNAGMVGQGLYAPVDDIINYYDALALMKLIGNDQFTFRERYQAVTRQKQQGLQQYAESINGLGVGRQ